MPPPRPNTSCVIKRLSLFVREAKHWAISRVPWMKFSAPPLGTERTARYDCFLIWKMRGGGGYSVAGKEPNADGTTAGTRSQSVRLDYRHDAERIGLTWRQCSNRAERDNTRDAHPGPQESFLMLCALSSDGGIEWTTIGERWLRERNSRQQQHSPSTASRPSASH
jgi:hypothetical protein